jgi:Uri superfamily endonuclease
LRLVHPQRIRIGRLGLLGFAGGRYAYVGSACGPGGLRARIGHHLRATPRPHWHIDYLRAAAALTEVWYAAGDRRLEPVFAAICGDHRTHFSPVAGFGASDSRAPAHLFHIRYKLDVHWFARRLRPALPGTRLESWRPSDQAG